jgi:hypothetical protein
VDTLGFSEHQYIAVRHDDADHEHIHVAINKIRPETLRIHSPAWDHRKLFTGARALELELGSTPLRSRVRDRENVPQRAAGCEAHHGIESFARWARENLGPALRAIEVRSWDDLHGICGEFGVVIRPRGNGLVFEEYEQSLHHARAQRGPMARSPHLEASCATPDRARFNEDACRLTIAAWLTCLLRGGAQHRGSGPVRGQF